MEIETICRAAENTLEDLLKGFSGQLATHFEQVLTAQSQAAFAQTINNRIAEIEHDLLYIKDIAAASDGAQHDSLIARMEYELVKLRRGILASPMYTVIEAF